MASLTCSVTIPAPTPSTRGRRRILSLALMAALVPLPAAADEPVAESARAASQKIRGGTIVPVGSLEAVVQLAGCTGTLISDDTVLTAAHCYCGGNDCPASISDCASRATVTFDNVRPVGSSTRQDVPVRGDVIVHPYYCKDDGWLVQDYALIKLDQPASELVQVSPIFV
ncbi:MAG: trypsin-like serine protease, partial [Holophagales bacterium]|nr:trypsin-like serine protease [Holophagales bacterium]